MRSRSTSRVVKPTSAGILQRLDERRDSWKMSARASCKIFWSFSRDQVRTRRVLSVLLTTLPTSSS